MYEAARINDEISHSSALSGFLVGAVIGIALLAASAAVFFTCGLAAGLLAGVVTGLLASGALMGGEALGSLARTPTGKILTGSRNVFTNARRAALVERSAVKCERHSPLKRIAEGSETVFINGLPAARRDDRIECDAKIHSGSSNVFIGGGSKQYLEIDPEIPETLRTAVDWAFTLASLVGGLAGVARAAGTLGMRALTPCAVKYIGGFVVGEAVSRYVVAPAISGLLGRPVDVVTGRKLLLPHEETDFRLIARLPLTGARCYDSSLTRQGMLGRGWQHEWETALRMEQERIVYTDVQGRDIPFPRLQPGEKIRADAEQLTLSCLKDGRFVIHGLDETYHQFGAPDEQGRCRLERIEDSLGQHLQFEYADGRLMRVAGSGQELSLHYQDQRLAGIELLEGGSLGMLVRYGYDARGQLASVSDRDGRELRRFAYRDGLMVEQSNAQGLVCTYRWEVIDGQPRVVEHTSNSGERYRFSYDTASRRSEVEDVFGNRACWQYDEHKQITANTWFDGSNTAFEYDGHGNLQVIRLPGEREVRLTYDELGRLVNETDPLGRGTVTVYDGTSLRPLSLTYPDGSSWHAEYNHYGLLLAARDPLGRETRYEYRDDGLPARIIDARGGSKTMEWNSRGQVTAWTDCSGKTTRYGYDGNGYLQHITDATGRSTRIERNQAGAPLLVMRPDGTQEQFEYDVAGLPISHRDAAGCYRTWEYNVRGQVIAATGKSGRAITYEYDAHGRLTSLTNGNGAAYRFAYDAGDRLVRETRVDGIEKHFRYDEAGWTAAIDTVGRDGNGQIQRRTARLERDKAGRLQTRRTDTAVTRYKYDALDRLLVASSTPTPAGEELGIVSDTVRFEYDAAGRLIAEHGANGSLAYELDELGNLGKLRLPQGQALDILRYGSGHVHQLRIGDRVVSDIERDDLHREILRTQGRLSTAFGYDTLGRRSWQSTAVPEIDHDAPKLPGRAQGVLWRTYDYNPADELFEQGDALRGSRQFSYDSDGRLLNRTTRHDSEHFIWDDADNLQAYGSHGRLENNRLTVWQNLRYEYDAFGNVRTKKKGKLQEQQFIYDADDRLVEVRGSMGQRDTVTRFAYDALGRRIGKTVRPLVGIGEQDRQETRFVWQGLRLLQEIDREAVRSYLYDQEGDGSYTPLARLDQAYRPDGSLSKGMLYYYHTDQIGTPLEVTGEDGKLLWAGEYSAWGRLERHVIGAPIELVEFTQNLRYAGQYADESTGLHYNTFRYYDPDIGRFLTQDPIGLAGGFNLYLYAPNSVMWMDPWGLSGIPFGFGSFGEFKQFGQTLQAGLAKMGFPGAASYMQGSAVTGVSFETKIPFDVGRVSDFDVAISQRNLYEHAEKLGIGKGGRTEPIKMDSDLAKKIGINDLLLKLSKKTGGREVNAMIFENVDEIKAKGPSTRIPGKC